MPPFRVGLPIKNKTQGGSSRKIKGFSIRRHVSQGRKGHLEIWSQAAPQNGKILDKMGSYIEISPKFQTAIALQPFVRIY